MFCTECGKSTNRLINKTLCSACYQRERRSPNIYYLPNKGEITFTPDGKIICHICGRAYDKIATHAWHTHHLSAAEYKEMFGLDAYKGILSDKSRKIAQLRNAENKEIVVVQNLLNNGKDTRFKPGSAGRPKEKMRLQTLFRLKHLT